MDRHSKTDDAAIKWDETILAVYWVFWAFHGSFRTLFGLLGSYWVFGGALIVSFRTLFGLWGSSWVLGALLGS